jgi:hypothetical protein
MRKLLVVFLLLIYSTCYGQSSIIVPTAAGGAVDTLARKFAQFVESKTNKSIVIENHKEGTDSSRNLGKSILFEFCNQNQRLCSTFAALEAQQ